MKTFKIIAILTIISFSCKRENYQVPKGCNYAPISNSFANNTATSIPINNQNFWLYADSIKDINTQLMVERKNFLLTMEKYYKVDNYNSVSFNQLIPQLTIIGDTLFTTEATPEISEPDCFKLRKYLFNVQDTSHLDNNTILYKSLDTIHTFAGNFTDNIIYQTGNAYKMIINKNVGILRIEFWSNDTTINRTLTLKTYEIK